MIDSDPRSKKHEMGNLRFSLATGDMRWFEGDCSKPCSNNNHNNGLLRTTSCSAMSGRCGQSMFAFKFGGKDVFCGIKGGGAGGLNGWMDG